MFTNQKEIQPSCSILIEQCYLVWYLCLLFQSLCQVCLFCSFGFCLITAKISNDGLKGLKQQTSYSSVQLNQTNLLLHTHSQDMGANQPRRSHPPCPSWLPPFYTSRLFLLVVPCAEQGLHPPPVKKRSANGHTLKAN